MTPFLCPGIVLISLTNIKRKHDETLEAGRMIESHDPGINCLEDFEIEG